ncbi:MAG: energy-coupling factor transporter ATPase [Erysipelotrichales bacterium]|nr:energy-coupling factor transporter ATPase [Erysipelotrichales bacterium]
MPITFDHVFYTYSKKTPFEQIGLEDINISLDEYKFIALVGHTGSGKSTLAQHITGLIIPDEGIVHVDEYVITPQKKKNKSIKKIREQVGLVFQFPEYQLFEETVLKDVAFGPKNFGASEENAIRNAKEALLKVGLDESYFDRSPFDLSGGEKRRVAIAGIIAVHPKVLILDEPTAGLDPQGSEKMMQLFREINANGTQIIMVTHDMDLVLEYADHVIVMKDGKVAKESSPLELFSSDDYQDLSLDYPRVFEVATELIKNGAKINIKNIKNIETLVKEICKGRDTYE